MSVYTHKTQANEQGTRVFSIVSGLFLVLSIAGGVIGVGGFIGFMIIGAFVNGLFDSSGMDAATLDALFSIFHRTFIYSFMAGIIFLLISGGADYLDEKINDH